MQNNDEKLQHQQQPAIGFGNQPSTSKKLQSHILTELDALCRLHILPTERLTGFPKPKRVSWPKTSEWSGFCQVFPQLRDAITPIECGKGGDCMYHAIAVALNELLGISRLSFQDIRNIAAHTLDSSNFELFRSAWVERVSVNVKAFQSMPPVQQMIVMKNSLLTCGQDSSGYAAWGDDSVLQLLLLQSNLFKHLGIGFAVLRMDKRVFGKSDPRRSHTKHHRIFSLQIFRTAETRHLILLLNLNQTHFQLLRTTGLHKSVDNGPNKHSVFAINGLPGELNVLSKNLQVILSHKDWP